MTKRKVKSAEDKKATRIAERMLKRGDSIEEVDDITELSKEAVIELKSLNYIFINSKRIDCLKIK